MYFVIFLGYTVDKRTSLATAPISTEMSSKYLKHSIVIPSKVSKKL